MNENQASHHEQDGTINQSDMSNVNNIPVENSITPIAEVKVEMSDSVIRNEKLTQDSKTTMLSAGVVNDHVVSEPPKENKASTVLLILLFIFLFAFVIGMPYIRTFIDELKNKNNLSQIEKEAIAEEKRQEAEENKNSNVITGEEKTKELVCTSGSNVVGNYTLVETQKFYYNAKNRVLSSQVISKYNFVTIDDTYNSLKQQCDENSLKYLTHEGYTMACSYGDNNIEISHEFDLETFIPIEDGNNNIQANITYKQDIEVVKTNLSNQGYTCE